MAESLMLITKEKKMENFSLKIHYYKSSQFEFKAD